MSEQIRAILKEHAKLSVDVAGLKDEDDLYGAGLTSQASVTLLLALEGKFDVEFPDSLLNRRTFESIKAIGTVVSQLVAGKGA
jgi:acyl carrier protein